MSAERLGQLLFFLAVRDRDGVKAHFSGELDAEVSQPADALDGDQVPGPGAAVSQGVEGRDTGAEDGRGLIEGESVGDGGQGLDRSDHVFGVATVIADAGDPMFETIDKITAPARRAL